MIKAAARGRDGKAVLVLGLSQEGVMRRELPRTAALRRRVLDALADGQKCRAEIIARCDDRSSRTSWRRVDRAISQLKTAGRIEAVTGAGFPRWRLVGRMSGAAEGL